MRRGTAGSTVFAYSYTLFTTFDAPRSRFRLQLHTFHYFSYLQDCLRSCFCLQLRTFHYFSLLFMPWEHAGRRWEHAGRRWEQAGRRGKHAGRRWEHREALGALAGSTRWEHARRPFHIPHSSSHMPPPMSSVHIMHGQQPFDASIGFYPRARGGMQ